MSPQSMSYKTLKYNISLVMKLKFKENNVVSYSADMFKLYLDYTLNYALFVFILTIYHFVHQKSFIWNILLFVNWLQVSSYTRGRVDNRQWLSLNGMFTSSRVIHHLAHWNNFSLYLTSVSYQIKHSCNC